MTDLRALDGRMGSLVEILPEPGEVFEALAELGAGLACVRRDLLADAIETLEALATLDDEALARRFEERRRWLVDDE